MSLSGPLALGGSERAARSMVDLAPEGAPGVEVLDALVHSDDPAVLDAELDLHLEVEAGVTATCGVVGAGEHPAVADVRDRQRLHAERSPRMPDDPPERARGGAPTPVLGSVRQGESHVAARQPPARQRPPALEGVEPALDHLLRGQTPAALRALICAASSRESSSTGSSSIPSASSIRRSASHTFFGSKGPCRYVPITLPRCTPSVR